VERHCPDGEPQYLFGQWINAGRELFVPSPTRAISRTVGLLIEGDLMLPEEQFMRSSMLARTVKERFAADVEASKDLTPAERERIIDMGLRALAGDPTLGSPDANPTPDR
jgi:hypothetical protein